MIVQITVVVIFFANAATADVSSNTQSLQQKLQVHHAAVKMRGYFLLDTSVVWTASPDTNWQDYPDIAFDGVNYLVVWQDDRNGDYDVYGARFTHEGVVIDTGAFAIVTAPGDQKHPAVAFDGNNYLVVWHDHRAGDSDIYGARVTTSGLVLDTLSFPIASLQNEQSYPSIAFGGNQYMIAWRDLRNVDSTALYGARVDTAGQLIDTSGIAIAPTGQPERSAIAFDGTNFFVVWAKALWAGSYANIYGARVSASGHVLDTNAIFIGHGTHNWYCNHPSVAFDGSNYLVVYSEMWGYPDVFTSVYGHRVNQDGIVLDSNPILVHDHSGSMPKAAFDGANYLITWVREVPNWPPHYFEIKARRMTCTGQLMGETATVSTGANWRRSPAIVFDGANYCVVWADCRDYISSTIYGSRIDTSSAVLDPSGIPIAVSSSAVAQSQHEPTVSSDGTDYLAVWKDEYAGDIYGIRSSNTGIILDTLPIVISEHLNPECGPCVSWNGTNYLAAWKRIIAGPTPTGYITTARIDQAGAVLDPGGLALVYSACGYPSVSFDGVNHLIVFHRLHYIDYTHVANTIRGLLVDQGNGLISHFAVQYSNDWEYRTSPVVAFDGSNYLVVYYTYGGLHGIYGKRVTPAGAPIGPEILISNTLSYNPSVAFGDLRYLTVWESNTDVFGRFVAPSGSVSDSTFTICVAADSQAWLAVNFDGTHYWVVWQDHRNGEWDIYGARVDTTGSVLDVFPVSLQPGDQVAPAITRGPDDQLLITYSGWTDTINGQPANAMRIWGIFSTDVVGIEENVQSADVVWKRLSIVPNPFHNCTDIRYQITDSSRDDVSLRIFDITGRLVKEFCRLSSIIGHPLSVQWDGTDDKGKRLPQGVYFVSFTANDYSDTEKVVFLR